MAQLPNPLPQSNIPYTDPKTGRLTQSAYQYFFALDRVLRIFVGANNTAGGSGAPVTQLVAAANDAAAAALGVPVGGLYENGGAVRIRLV